MAVRSWRRYRPRAATPWSSLRCLPAILDIDNTGTELLVSHTPGTADGDLAVMPVLGGIERRVGDVRINHRGQYGIAATWTPDKSHIVYAKGTELRLVGSDGSESRTLLTAPGIPFAPRVSPDGERLRYTVRDAKTGAFTLWEAGTDGSAPHPLLPGWTGAQNPCCGTWTADGRYYVFEADGNLWARSEAGGLFRRRLERSGATHVRAAAVLGSDAKPGRQAPVRGGRSAQGPAGAVRPAIEALR